MTQGSLQFGIRNKEEMNAPYVAKMYDQLVVYLESEINGLLYNNK